ncbi:MAG TPA: GNAT family protein [Sphingomicrobium sp.]|nr:GNAT family protein [Sphingomicrobium sp.]
MSWLTDPVLEDDHVRLEPVQTGHVEALEEAAAESDLASLWYTNAPSREDVSGDVTRRLEFRSQGTWAPYTIFDQKSGRALGMSGYLNIPKEIRRPEIGGTWMRRSAHRTGANVAAKRLLLAHAFDQLGCMAVEFRTHRFNLQSRRAIEALGAQLDGILRNHFDAFGKPRDTCVYSITSAEWPNVRRHLDWRLERNSAGSQ